MTYDSPIAFDLPVVQRKKRCPPVLRAAWSPRTTDWFCCARWSAACVWPTLCRVACGIGATLRRWFTGCRRCCFHMFAIAYDYEDVDACDVRRTDPRSSWSLAGCCVHSRPWASWRTPRHVSKWSAWRFPCRLGWKIRRRRGGASAKQKARPAAVFESSAKARAVVSRRRLSGDHNAGPCARPTGKDGRVEAGGRLRPRL